MASRQGPVHVATTKREYKGKVYETHLLRRTYREGDKVKHETVGNVSHLPSGVIDLIRRALRGERLVGAEEAFEITRSAPHGHVRAVLGSLRRLGLEGIISSETCRERDLVVAMIVARILDPCSKLATARALEEETSSTSLGEVLGVGFPDVDELYRAMDWLFERQPDIEERLAGRHLSDGSLVLYDVTSTYFEGRKCPLARLGHNRDGKKGKLQIVVGLLCATDGVPVAATVFEGNTADPKTLSAQITKVRSRFGLERVVLVGDRGMITEARLRKDVRTEEGVDWITALRAPSIRKLVQHGSLQVSLFDEADLAEISDPSFPGERLIVCKNPLLAAERSRKREELLSATQKELDRIVQATMRPKRALRGQEKIQLRVGKVLNRFRMGKHFQVEIRGDSFRYCRNEASIRQEAALDGIYVIRTSVPAHTLSPEDTVRAYKGLSSAERAFRTLKGIDLKVRPIYHWVPDRVRTHVFLCMLAYYVEWHMRAALAPLLFQDHDKKSALEKRGSIVAPAARSDKAQSKATKRQTEEGLPVHSFRSLLSDLATLTKNTVQMRVTGTIFDLYTVPTPVQREAFRLLGLPLRL